MKDILDIFKKIVFILFAFISSFVLFWGGIIVGQVILNSIPLQGSLWRELTLYLPLTGIWIVFGIVVIVLKVKKKNSEIVKELKVTKCHTVHELIVGLGVGAGLNGLCVFIIYVCRNIDLDYTTNKQN